MRKIIAVLFTLVLLASVCVMGVSAAGIDANEQKILNELDTTITHGKYTFHIPDEYINQAKNHFLKEGNEMTAEEAEKILGFIQEGEEVIHKVLETHVFTGNEIHMEDFTLEEKQAILAAGQKACEVKELTLTYDDKHVTIVENATNKVVFDDDPIVKVTGAEAFGYVAIAVSVLFVGLATVAFVTKKAN